MVTWTEEQLLQGRLSKCCRRSWQVAVLPRLLGDSRGEAETWKHELQQTCQVVHRCEELAC